MDEKNKPQLSLIILCYREEDYIPFFVDQVKKNLNKHEIPYQLILVSNYYKNSPKQDKSPEVIKRLAKDNALIIAVSKEKQGKMGWDLRTGFDKATGSIVAFTDGDGQVAPEDIAIAYNKLVKEGLDVVFGQRIERKDGKMRALTSGIYNRIFRIFFPRVKIHDSNGKPKIFNKEAFLKMNLSSNNWFVDSEIVIQSTYRNFKIGTVPTIFYANTRRPSITSPWSIIESLRDVVNYRLKLFFNKKKILS